ncbi:hypothetical protein G4G28_09330 [Massilia sp. Dwa41.01b]|uniref:hypothetical protein n=1 Tax=unclassified Massilia TaxID=2609279 RepID=UPI0016046C89|nr:MULTISPECIES: hypothetical protein [unclassified Massilia]QNA88642.1 hypothetical protein G4G28_09330 [Massilia sp. Dwa41.01b]QNA99533.1 hypothetical protein G4G31_12985 [Massilia sp. Se16.2.3]
MNPSHKNTDPAAGSRPYMEEGDIGSGEKTPGQKETEEMIKEIPPLQPGSARDNAKREDETTPKD